MSRFASNSAHAGKRKKVPPHCDLHYAAPEVVLAFEDGRALAAHPSADVWSIGVVAYEALTGNSLFSDSASLEQVSEHANGFQPYPWEAIKRGDAFSKCPARHLLASCLERDPMRRTSARELLHGVDALIRKYQRKGML